VLKSTRLPAAIDDSWRPGAAVSLTRCVRRSYRLDLIAVGQPCLLWVSGHDRPGVHAVGAVAGPVSDDEHGDGPAVPVRLALLPEPILRADLLTDPRIRDAEVLRMPAGSNPSWLSREQFAAVRDRLPASGLGPWGP
jgi:hypothetical protein